MKKLLLSALIFLGVTSFVQAAGCTGTGSCYWVGGTGSWSDTTHWATTDGGATTGGLPSSTDNCNFTNLSSAANAAYTATVDVSATCLDFVMAGPGGGNKVTWAGSSALDIRGSLNLSGGTAGITRTFTGTLNFSSVATGRTLTFNSVVMASATTFNGVGGGWTIQDVWNNGNSNLTVTNGSLALNNTTLTLGTFDSSNSNTRSLNFGSSTLNVSSAWTMTTVTGLTFTASTSLVVLSGTAPIFDGGGLTYYEVDFTSSSVSSSNNRLIGPVISGSNTFSTLKRTTSGYTALILASDQTVTSNLVFTGGNNNTQRLLVLASSGGASTAVSPTSNRTITCNGAISLTNVDFEGITGAGSCSWTGTSIGNAGGNSGITADATRTLYWVHSATASINYFGGGRWATSTGGAVGVADPLPQDSVFFDLNSFPTSGKTVIQNLTGLRLSKVVNWTGVTNSPTFSNSTISNIYGSLTFASGMSVSASPGYAFTSQSNESITWAGLNPGQFYVNSVATVTFNDTASSTSGLLLVAGLLDLGNQSHTFTTANLLAGPFSATTSINLGTGTLTLTGAGSVVSNSAPSNVTIVKGSSTIKVINQTNSAITFAGAGKTFNNVWFSRGPSTATTTISGSNTFNNFKDDGTATHELRFTNGTTQNIASWTVRGSPTATIYINSATTATFNLNLTGTSNACSEYLNVQHAVVKPTRRWFAGYNSINNQSVVTAGSGWLFEACPASAGIKNGKMIIRNGKVVIKNP